MAVTVGPLLTAVGPAGPAAKGASSKYFVYKDPGDGLIHAVNNRTGATDHTGSTTSVVVANLLTDLGSTAATISFSDDTHVFAANITVPTNVGIKTVKGTLLSQNTGVTLTLNGNLDAGAYQIFGGPGTVVLGTGACPLLYAEWWGAKGDGSADDSVPLQAALTTSVASGIPLRSLPGRTYKHGTTITCTLANLSEPLEWSAYGAIFDYTGSSWALHITTNTTGLVGGNVYLDAWKRLTLRGAYIKGSGSATGGIYLDGCSSCRFPDTVLSGFTSIAAKTGSVCIYGQQYNWCEENEFDNLRIENCGNGITLWSDITGSSCENNHFRNVNIDVTIAGGSGVRAIDSANVNIARSVFAGVVVHVFANSVTAFNLGNAYVLGTVFLAPAMDVYASPTGMQCFYYTGTNPLTVLGATSFGNFTPQTYLFSGGGAYNSLGDTGYFLALPGGYLQLSNAAPASGAALGSVGLNFVNGNNVGGTLTYRQMQLKGDIDTSGLYRLAVFNDAADGGAKVLTIDKNGNLVIPLGDLYVGTAYRVMKHPYGHSEHSEHSAGPIAGPASLASGATTYMTAITFAQAFTVAPTPSAQCWSVSGVSADQIVCRATTTTTAITIAVTNYGIATATSIYVTWTAVGQDS